MSSDEKEFDKLTQNLGGRPKIEFNYDMFEKLCALQCTKSEIASFFECSEDTVDRRVKEVYGCTWLEAFKRFREKGNISLRRMQWKQAERSTSMLIWLGKQFLNQTDKVIHIQENEFERLSDEDLLRAEKELIEEKEKQGKLIIDVKSARTPTTDKASQDPERKD